MMTDEVDVVIGVDTHKHTHTAAVVTAVGGVVSTTTVATTVVGYRQLLQTARGWSRRVWAIEGTASYGAGLCRFLEATGEQVTEIDRPRRPARATGPSPTSSTPCAPPGRPWPVPIWPCREPAVNARRYASW